MLVEAVFVLPVVVFIVFAIMEFGLLFAASSTASASTRNGVRFGSANYAISGSNQAAADQIAASVAKDLSARTDLDTPIQMTIYQADGSGNPTGGTFTGCSMNCYHYTWSGSAWSYVSGTWANPSACIIQDPNDPNAGVNTLDSIGVYVEMRHNFFTGAFGSSQLIKEHTVSRLEPLPLSQC